MPARRAAAWRQLALVALHLCPLTLYYTCRHRHNPRRHCCTSADSHSLAPSLGRPFAMPKPVTDPAQARQPCASCGRPALPGSPASAAAPPPARPASFLAAAAQLCPSRCRLQIVQRPPEISDYPDRISDTTVAFAMYVQRPTRWQLAPVRPVWRCLYCWGMSGPFWRTFGPCRTVNTRVPLHMFPLQVQGCARDCGW